jgi:hypothetical protein
VFTQKRKPFGGIIFDKTSKLIQHLVAYNFIENEAFTLPKNIRIYNNVICFYQELPKISFQR